VKFLFIYLFVINEFYIANGIIGTVAVLIPHVRFWVKIKVGKIHSLKVFL